MQSNEEDAQLAKLHNVDIRYRRIYSMVYFVCWVQTLGGRGDVISHACLNPPRPRARRPPPSRSLPTPQQQLQTYLSISE